MEDMHRSERGALLVGVMVAVLVISSIVIGFVVGMVTDPQRRADVRASASEYTYSQKVGEKAPCTNTVRWYIITLFCR